MFASIDLVEMHEHRFESFQNIIYILIPEVILSVVVLVELLVMFGKMLITKFFNCFCFIFYLPSLL